MELADLRTFIAVTDTGSFSAASETLFLTQPAVSKRIAALEEDLRARLFDRMARRVELTEAGRALLPHARHILGELESSRQAVADLQGTVGGRLRIGTSHHVGLHRLPPILRHYSTHYPNVELDLHFMDSEQACLAVEQSELELAVVTLPEQPAATLVTELLWPDPLDFVAAPDHPLAARSAIPHSELADWPAILPATTTFTRRIVAALLGTQSDRLRIALETNYLETIRMMVSVGLGWSALPRTLNGGELTVLAVEDGAMSRQLGLVTRVGRTPANATGAFIEVARAQARADRQFPD